VTLGEANDAKPFYVFNVQLNVTS